MRKIGEGDDADFSDASGLAQHRFSIAQVLQGVDLQHHVKRLIGQHVQAIVQVQLNHVHAALHTGVHVHITEFHAIAGAAVVLLQMGQQGAIAATQVEHAGALGYQPGNGLQSEQIAHVEPPALKSLVMLSK